MLSAEGCPRGQGWTARVAQRFWGLLSLPPSLVIMIHTVLYCAVSYASKEKHKGIKSARGAVPGRPHPPTHRIGHMASRAKADGRLREVRQTAAGLNPAAALWMHSAQTSCLWSEPKRPSERQPWGPACFSDKLQAAKEAHAPCSLRLQYYCSDCPPSPPTSHDTSAESAESACSVYELAACLTRRYYR